MIVSSDRCAKKVHRHPKALKQRAMVTVVVLPQLPSAQWDAFPRHHSLAKCMQQHNKASSCLTLHNFKNDSLHGNTAELLDSRTDFESTYLQYCIVLCLRVLLNSCEFQTWQRAYKHTSGTLSSDARRRCHACTVQECTTNRGY
eukprot:5938924-Amphidinium_carterae.1